MTARSYRHLLLELLSETDLTHFSASIDKTLDGFNVSDLAHVFVDVAFLTSAIQFVVEERWIQDQNTAKEISFAKFIKKLFKAELSPVLFLHEFFENSSVEGISDAKKNAAVVQKAVIQLAKSKSAADQKIFASTSLRLMSDLFEFEHQMVLEKQELGLNVGLKLYRTFDMLDEIFNLDYKADDGMVSPVENKERLYEGAGIGVQSGYSTALIALRYLNPVKGSKFVDLGAGYGRVGLVVGLTRPDIEFIGYEFVPHRVAIAVKACENLALEQHVHFHVQDLSVKDFVIPAAETYYIYDSFSEETYVHVIAQLVEISRKKKITIITKGNARKWLEGADQKGNWSHPQQFDNGNLCFFRSNLKS